MACVKSYASILLALHAMRMMRSLRLAGNTLSAVGVTRGLKSASTSGRVRDNKSSSLAHVPLRNSSQNRHRLTGCTVSACAVGRPEVDSDATEWRHCRRIRHCVTCCAREQRENDARVYDVVCLRWSTACRLLEQWVSPVAYRFLLFFALLYEFREWLCPPGTSVIYEHFETVKKVV